MPPVLPSWWKWLAVALLGAVLAGAFVWRSGKHDEGVIVEQQESSRPLSAVSPPEATKRLIGQTEARTPEKPSAELSAEPLEEMRQRFAARTEFAQRLQKESAADLLSRLGTLWNATGVASPASEEKALVMMALTRALHSVEAISNGEVYEQLGALLEGTALSLTAKLEIASMLGSVQTPQSVRILLGEYQKAADSNLRESLGNAIARTGENRWEGQIHEDLSPPLEAAWPLAKDDPKLAQALADGLAKVGTQNGVQLLVGEVLRSAQTLEGLSDLKDVQGQAAFLALEKVRNPNAIAVLSAGLTKPDSSDLQRYVCGTSLAAMGKADATQALLRWAATAPDQEAVWAERWFGRMRDTGSFQLVATALSETSAIKFTSAPVQNAVANGQRNR
jgi:hypothetical protein